MRSARQASACRSKFTFIDRWNGFIINGDGDVCFALSAERVKKYLFKFCDGGRQTGSSLYGMIVGWRGVACIGQRAGGRPCKQPISRDAGLVGVHWAFGVHTKG